MDCDNFEKKILFYLDGECDIDTRNSFNNHLNTCKECNQLFNNISSSYLTLQDSKITEENPFFYNKLLNRIENSNKRSNWLDRFFQTRLAFQVSSYALLVVFALLIGHTLGIGTGIQESSLKNTYEITDEDLFRETYYLSLNSEDFYVYNAIEQID